LSIKRPACPPVAAGKQSGTETMPIGEIDRKPAPPPSHQLLIQRLLRRLHEASGDRYVLLQGPCDLRLSDVEYRQPDLMLISYEHADMIGDTAVNGPPDLIIEVLTKTSDCLDRIVKKKNYARFGVSEYWIIDGENQQIEQYLLPREGHVYRLNRIFSREDRIQSGLFAQASFKISELLEGP